MTAIFCLLSGFSVLMGRIECQRAPKIQFPGGIVGPEGESLLNSFAIFTTHRWQDRDLCPRGRGQSDMAVRIRLPSFLSTARQRCNKCQWNWIGNSRLVKL